MEYEYDAGLEPTYKGSFLKSFRRQIDDCYFNFIIVDAIFDKIDYLDEFWSYAKSKGFQVCCLIKSFFAFPLLIIFIASVDTYGCIKLY